MSEFEKNGDVYVYECRNGRSGKITIIPKEYLVKIGMEEMIRWDGSLIEALIAIKKQYESFANAVMKKLQEQIDIEAAKTRDK